MRNQHRLDFNGRDPEPPYLKAIIRSTDMKKETLFIFAVYVSSTNPAVLDRVLG
jgi:hypothetical protein